MGRVWSFATSLSQVEQRRLEATALIGEQLAAVVYYDIDYRRDELRPDTTGLHRVTGPAEWTDPSWRTPLGDSVDFGLELRTETGRLFSVTWDPPGMREGIGIQEEPLAGGALRPSADAAAWDVSARSRWDTVLGSPVQAVDLHYTPWDPHDDSYWCTRITLETDRSSVVMMLGERTDDGELKPAADTVAVLFSPIELPEWEVRPNV